MSVTWLQYPIEGVWPFRGHPEAVRLHGRVFTKAKFKQAYHRIVEQYREAVTTNSWHLSVRADGTYKIDHADGNNPDMGRPVEHLLNDHPIGEVIKAGVLLGGLALLVGAILKT
jgi:hypothetical protein